MTEANKALNKLWHILKIQKILSDILTKAGRFI